MKKFWKKTEGFTLVELIVVIAILGVLAGIGTVGYGGYVKKANMAADEQLVSGVKNALQLAYYGDLPSQNSGYVVLSASGADDGEAEEGGFVDKAMTAAFGENWEETCVLKYDGWGINELLAVVAEYEDDVVEKINNSTFMKNPEGMMDAATNLLGIAADRIAGSNPDTIAGYLTGLGGELSDDYNRLGTLTSGEKGIAISNLLVAHFAKAMSPGSAMEETGATESVSGLATYYAQVYAFCEHDEDDTLLNVFNEALGNATYAEISTGNSANVFKRKLAQSGNDEAFNRLGNYLNTYGGNDEDALKHMMKAVSVVADGYKDKDSLTNEGLYNSSEVKGQVNSFANAIRAKAAGKIPDEIPEGDVLVLLYENGTTDSTLALSE